MMFWISSNFTEKQNSQPQNKYLPSTVPGMKGLKKP